MSCKTVHSCVALACVTLAAPAARAELREKVFGLEITLVMPRFESGSPTAFATTALGSRLSYAYGVTSEIYVVGRGTFWHISDAYIEGYRAPAAQGSTVVGELRFRGEGYRIETGAKWKFLDGYNLAPYLEAYGGLQWSTYRNVDLRNGGTSSAADVGDFAEGSATVAAGVSLDYRIANTLIVGASTHWTRVFDDLYRQDLTASLLVAYYWF
jgi:hypothetical protein